MAKAKYPLWSEWELIFKDSDEFSCIWGRFNLNKEKSLGIRWHYFPHMEGVPTYMVLQKFLVQPTLEKMLAYATINGKATQVKKIQKALKELASYNWNNNSVWID